MARRIFSTRAATGRLWAPVRLALAADGNRHADPTLRVVTACHPSIFALGGMPRNRYPSTRRAATDTRYTPAAASTMAASGLTGVP